MSFLVQTRQPNSEQQSTILGSWVLTLPLFNACTYNQIGKCAMLSIDYSVSIHGQWPPINT